jgi:hypothetical protein
MRRFVVGPTKPLFVTLRSLGSIPLPVHFQPSKVRVKFVFLQFLAGVCSPTLASNSVASMPHQQMYSPQFHRNLDATVKTNLGASPHSPCVGFDFYSLAQQPKYRFSIQRSSKSATTEQTTTFTLGNTFVSRFKANLPAK